MIIGRFFVQERFFKLWIKYFSSLPRADAQRFHRFLSSFLGDRTTGQVTCSILEVEGGSGLHFFDYCVPHSFFR